MIRSVKTEAIVLRKRGLLEKDVLVSLFTEAEGKVVIIAKGVKKITSRRSPHLQTGNLILTQLNLRKDIYYLEGSSLMSGFSALKSDRSRVEALFKFFYVLDRLLPERQKEQRAYNLTKSFLVKLSRFNSKEILIDFLNRLLSCLGYTKNNHNIFELEEIISELINEKPSLFRI